MAISASQIKTNNVSEDEDVHEKSVCKSIRKIVKLSTNSKFLKEVELLTRCRNSKDLECFLIEKLTNPSSSNSREPINLTETAEDLKAEDIMYSEFIDSLQ